MSRLFFVALLFAISPIAINAETIVSFDVGASGANALGVNDVAGVVQASNWNLLTGAGLYDSHINAVDHTGASTGINLQLGYDQATGLPGENGEKADNVNYQLNSFHGFSHTSTNAIERNNARLMQDIAFVNGNTDFFTVDFTGIGFDDYDIYLYTGAGGPSLDNRDRGGSITDGNTTYYVKGFDAGAGGSDFVQGTETGSFAAAGAADYVIFEGLTGASQSFTFEAIDTQIFFSGAQIVARTAATSAASTTAVPEPSSALLFTVVGFGLVTRRRRRK